MDGEKIWQFKNNDRLCRDKRLHARNLYYRLKLLHYTHCAEGEKESTQD